MVSLDAYAYIVMCDVIAVIRCIFFFTKRRQTSCTRTDTPVPDTTRLPSGQVAGGLRDEGDEADPVVQAVKALRADAAVRHPVRLVRGDERGDALLAQPHVGGGQDVGAGVEIGRASCRERVCQYV